MVERGSDEAMARGNVAFVEEKENMTRKEG
jgi:hypothetical protein